MAALQETRVDIDPECNPDIVADMRNLGDIGKYDILFCSHALEHLYPHEIVPTLKGFRNVLNEGGAAVIIVPNLEKIRPTREVVYESPCGPVTGHDMYYGMGKCVEQTPYMAHHCGFVPETLTLDMEGAGFQNVYSMADESYNLIGIGS